MTTYKYGLRIRELENIRLYFYASNELTAVDKATGAATIFHIWFRSREKRKFRPFRKALTYQKRFTMADIHRLARKWDIESQHTTRLHSRITEGLESNNYRMLRPEGRVSNKPYGKAK